MQHEAHVLRDKAALVTGAARRIGADVARTLHEAGMRVALHYNTSGREARALTAELNAHRPDSAFALQADLLEPEAPQRLLDALAAESDRLDLLVNNASTFYATPLGQITREHWRDLLGTNLAAPLFLSQAAAPALRASTGAIVNIVDIHAERPLPGYSVYCAAKAGLVAITRALARELAPQVRVNGVAPGAILWPDSQDFGETDKQAVLARTPLARCGEPGDISRAVLFLARDAGFVTGQILGVDGGRSLA